VRTENDGSRRRSSRPSSSTTSCTSR
jgi:hypothetical protein